MKVIVQKCLESSVSVDGKVVSTIGKGLMVLVGFTHNDTEKDIEFLTKKVVNLRVFEDEKGVMNKSVLEEQGEILCISQFTLYGDAQKGNRPSYDQAMKGTDAINLYNLFCEKLNQFVPTKKGVFGGDMKVSLINDGPTTIIVHSKK